jgi:flagellar hook-associated protein 2
MAGLSLSGLASGVDTASIVEQLMALDRQGTTRITYRQAAVTAQQTGLKDVASKLAALKNAAAALGSSDAWKQTQSATSSDPTRVGVAQTGGAGIGGHTLQVNRLASSAQRGYSFPGGVAGSISISYVEGDPKTINVSVAADATLQQVADAINAKTSGPVVAAVVKNAANQERLVLSSRITGSDSDFAVTSTALNPDTTYNTVDLDALDASYTLDGGAPQTSKTNVLENAIPGLSVTLKAVTASPATLSVSEPALDRDSVKTKIKTFVSAYNAVVDSTRTLLDAKPTMNPTSEFQAGYGVLHGDAGLQGMLSALRTQFTTFTDAVGIKDLSDIGITPPKAVGGTISADGKAGKIVLDETKLTAALDADWTAVSGFFTTFSASVKTFVDKQTGGSGVIDERLKTADRNLTRLKEQMDTANDRLDAKEKRLKAQFAAMELALQQSQTQQAWLTGQLAALNKQQ